MSDRGGGELFIVDSSVSGWTGLKYLQQWTDLADSFDVATGFFEIGALLALDGKWQQLDKIGGPATTGPVCGPSGRRRSAHGGQRFQRRSS